MRKFKIDMKHPYFLMGIVVLLTACQTKSNSTMISENIIQNCITHTISTHPDADSTLVARGVKQMAALWQSTDGSEKEFTDLVYNCYAGTRDDRKTLYERLSFILS